MTANFLAAAALIGLAGAGVAGAADLRSDQALPQLTAAMAMEGMGGGGQGASCRVDVVRTGTPGAAAVTKQVLGNGACVCTVTTGPAGGNGSAEDVVTGLLQSRSCEGAPPPGENVGQQVSQAATGGGGSQAVLPVLLGAVGAAGLAVALGNDSGG